MNQSQTTVQSATKQPPPAQTSLAAGITMPAIPSPTARIKVLHIITHLGFGGAQDNTLLTVKGHCRDRYEVHLVAGQDYTDWEARGQAYADHFMRMPDLCRAVQPRADRRALAQLTALMREQEYQVVHTHSAKAGTLGRMAAKRAGVPVTIHTFHSFGWQVARQANPRPWEALPAAAKKHFYVMVERYAAGLADGLITVSALNREEAVALHVAPPEKLTTIYSGIDLSRFDVQVDRAGQCRSLGLDPDRPIIGAIGRLSVQKAPLDFVTAAKLVLREKPEVQFVMVGDGPLAAEVRQAIAGEPRIQLFGYRDDVPELLAVFDMFVLSSLWEGLGRALTEAMIVGVPVAATAVDGVPELVTHRKTGMLSPPGDPVRLADNMVWLLDHPQDAQRMVRAARERVVPAFGAGRMVEQIEALYERLLAEKGCQ